MNSAGDINAVNVGAGDIQTAFECIRLKECWISPNAGFIASLTAPKSGKPKMIVHKLRHDALGDMVMPETPGSEVAAFGAASKYFAFVSQDSDTVHVSILNLTPPVQKPMRANLSQIKSGAHQASPPSYLSEIASSRRSLQTPLRCPLRIGWTPSFRIPPSPTKANLARTRTNQIRPKTVTSKTYRSTWTSQSRRTISPNLLFS